MISPTRLLVIDAFIDGIYRQTDIIPSGSGMVAEANDAAAFSSPPTMDRSVHPPPPPRLTPTLFFQDACLPAPAAPAPAAPASQRASATAVTIDFSPRHHRRPSRNHHRHHHVTRNFHRPSPGAFQRRLSPACRPASPRLTLSPTTIDYFTSLFRLPFDEYYAPREDAAPAPRCPIQRRRHDAAPERWRITMPRRRRCCQMGFSSSTMLRAAAAPPPARIDDITPTDAATRRRRLFIDDGCRVIAQKDTTMTIHTI